EAGDETEESGFSAAARPDEGDQSAGIDLQRHGLQREEFRAVAGVEAFADVADQQLRAFVDGVGRGAHHLIIPFCQTRTRSRSRKSSVMMEEKKMAMMTSAE